MKRTLLSYTKWQIAKGQKLFQNSCWLNIPQSNLKFIAFQKHNYICGLVMGNIISGLFYYLILLPISWLPLPLLYVLSDILFFFLYLLSGYRKKVVMEKPA
jgi:hypothetical protein